MTDTVAERSSSICASMSDDPKALVAYAKWFGKVQEEVASARMAGITAKDMTLLCTFKDGTQKEVVIPIKPHLRGYDDLKPRLLEMKAVALEGLGVINPPRIDTFEFPMQALWLGIFTTVALLPHFADDIPASSPVSPPLHIARNFFGAKTFALSFWVTVVAHVCQSFYTFSLCWKHSMPFFVGAQYVVSSLCFGFPILASLKERIQSARVRSVIKTE